MLGCRPLGEAVDPPIDPDPVAPLGVVPLGRIRVARIEGLGGGEVASLMSSDASQGSPQFKRIPTHIKILSDKLSFLFRFMRKA